MKIKYYLFFLSIVFISCEKTNKDNNVESFQSHPGGIYISNEGTYQNGNGTVSYYDLNGDVVTNEVFELANGGQNLGDICQSMCEINNKLFVVVNNSGKIEVCELYTMKRITSISGISSPRYILPIGNSRAYVSDIHSTNVSILNTDLNTISGTISMTDTIEQMIVANNKVYATSMFSDYIYVIDPATDLLTDSILITRGGNSIIQDANGKLWVTCGGDYQNVVAAIYRIDPATKNIEFSKLFSIYDFTSKLATSPNKDYVYFLNNGVWKMSVTSNAYPSTPFIASSGNSFYGLGIDSSRNEIYVSDAINFLQKGKILRYNSSAILLDNFNAGIAPGEFLFIR
jgi:YVTN family beta-propeller protein